MLQEFWILLFFLLLFAGSWFGGGDVWLPGTMILSYLLLIWLRNRREYERTVFRQQIRSYRTELRQGGTVVVDGLLLRRESVVTSYDLTVGLILTSLTISSPYRLYTDDDTPEALLYSLGSLITGWWAFPSGPLQTIKLITQNLSGGNKETVAALFERQKPVHAA